MPWSMRTEGGQVLVVRDRDKKVVGRHKDRRKALAQLRVLYSLEKARFASRSEAGRYAANMRWKGQGKKDNSERITSNFKSDGKNSGTVWATDKETGKVVGALKFDGNFIAKIYVLKDYRRKGIASFLYEEAKKRNGGVEMKADDYTVAGAGFMSAVTGKEVYQTGDFSFSPDLSEMWLGGLERDALKKASFGGDRSEAGRYAANMRWQGQGQKEQEKVGLDGYPKINNDLEELFINTPILNSGLGKTIEEINKEIRERERESQTEDEILPMVIFSSYLGKGSNEFYGALNRHLRRGNPLKDSLREKLSEEDEEQVERLEREIRQLERDQDEDDDTDNSSEIESLREEIAEIEGEDDDDDERIDADDWNYDEHSESDFDSQYGSIPISINGEDVKMPKVVAYGLMDDAFRELSMVMPSNLRVYRGIDPETITSLEASVGKTVEDLGFCSTSTDPNKAIAFSGVGVPMQSQLQTEYYKEGDTLSSDKRIATILIPKGLKVVMPNRGGEGEVILNRGTQFEVVGVNETGPILKVVANNENN